MHDHIKTQWVNALRSGKYTQLQGALANADRTKHCCLGVLCELAVEAGVVTTKQNLTGNSTIYVVGDDEQQSVLPEAVAEWAGIIRVITADAVNPIVAGHELAVWNDGQYIDDDGRYQDLEPKSFEQIADLIEEHL